MIVADSSALIAIAIKEADAEIYFRVLANNPMLVGAPTLLETFIVLTNKGGVARANEFLAGFLVDIEVSVVPFDAPLLAAAQAAHDRFGRNRHPAQLNFGDCMAYAVAKVHNTPLLYKGNDFSRTDIRSALP